MILMNKRLLDPYLISREHVALYCLSMGTLAFFPCINLAFCILYILVKHRNVDHSQKINPFTQFSV